MLEEIKNHFKTSRNINEKRSLTPILDRIRKQGYMSDQIYASYGEDSAAILPTPDAKDLILITTDAILPEFIEATPWGAGFSAIYVGIDDIIACGGRPLACSSIVGYQDEAIGKEIFRGILEATNLFKVPLIRGHTTTDSANLVLSSTLIGTIAKKDFLSAGGSCPGDFLAVIWDADGTHAKTKKLYWNTITMKTTEEFYGKRSFFKSAITEKYITACKDISNGGILGTIYQMMEFSEKGADLSIDSLGPALAAAKMPYSIIEFLFAYLTSAFLVTGPQKSKDKLIALVNAAEMQFTDIGTIKQEREITISEGSKTLILNK